MFKFIASFISFEFNQKQIRRQTVKKASRKSCEIDMKILNFDVVQVEHRDNKGKNSD